MKYIIEFIKEFDDLEKAEAFRQKLMKDYKMELEKKDVVIIYGKRK